jgi:hypothetical protein
MQFPRWSSQLINPSDVGALTLWIADAVNRFRELEDEIERLKEREAEYNGL